VVVGAGLGGRAAACHLRGAGREVVVLERADRSGGRAGALGRDGFRLDTGATVLTIPELAATFASAGTGLADHPRVLAAAPGVLRA
jgi:phytoene desaturase